MKKERLVNMKGYNTSIGYMGYSPGSGYSLFATEKEYEEYYEEMYGSCSQELDWGEIY